MATDAFKRTIIASFPRRSDLNIHVSLIEFAEVGEDVTYVDVREHIPSLSTYGRGLLLPLTSAGDIADAIKEAVKSHG